MSYELKIFVMLMYNSIPLSPFLVPPQI
jgi:hypothetical protein